MNITINIPSYKVTEKLFSFPGLLHAGGAKAFRNTFRSAENCFCVFQAWHWVFKTGTLSMFTFPKEAYKNLFISLRKPT